MRRALTLAALACSWSCAEPTTQFLKSSDAPMVYLVLSREPQDLAGRPVADSSIQGLVATAGTPIAARYRTIESFSMWRDSDTRMMSWLVDQLSQPIATPGDLVSLGGRGNVRLPWRGVGNELGRSDLTPDRYRLDLVSEGVHIRGETLLPASPAISLVELNGATVAVWHPVAGAARYLVTAETELAGGAGSADTTFVLHFDRKAALIPPHPQLVVTAIDAHLSRYLSDTLATSAGLEGAMGVFGAFSRTAIELPYKP